MGHKQKDWFGPQRFYLGIDVGGHSSGQWAWIRTVLSRSAAGRTGARRASRLCSTRRNRAPWSIVDQKNNIGSLIVYRWRAKRIDVGYLPGKAMKYAWEMFPGTAKNDRTDAEAIAQIGIGGRTAIRLIAETDDLGACVSLVSLQLSYATRCASPQQDPCGAAQVRSRRRARSGPLKRMAARGDGRMRRGKGHRRSGQEALLHAVRQARRLRPGKGRILEAVPRSSPPCPSTLMQRTCWQAALPGRSSRPTTRGAKLFSKLGRLLQDDKTYCCLLTIPGIGPRVPRRSLRRSS